MANKTYVKGGKCDEFIHALDIEKIFPNICSEIHVICEELGIDCTDAKKCG